MKKAKPARVALLDEEEIVMMGWRAIIKENRELCVSGSFTNVDELLAHVQKFKPRVVIVNPLMRHLDLSKLVKQLLALHSGLFILASCPPLSANENERIRKAGVHGIVCRSDSTKEMMRMLMKVLNGECDVSEEAKPSLFPDFYSKKETVNRMRRAKELLDRCTPKQKEVIFYFMQKLTRKEIAAEMKVSVFTVNNHFSIIYDKLEVHREADFIRVVNEAGGVSLK